MKLYTCTVKGYSAGISGFWTKNLLKEWNSAGITSSWTWIQTGKIKNLPISNNSRIINSKGSLPHNTNFLKFKHENVIKMKNKPDPALCGPSNLSNEIKKRVPKSRETIPLTEDAQRRKKLYTIYVCSSIIVNKQTIVAD
jgi:hypothetical protein